MKCPYRVKTTFIKPEKKTLSTSQGKIEINLIQTEDYEDCYEYDCPFYTTYADVPACTKADCEKGDCL